MPRKRKVITFSLRSEMDEQRRQVVNEEGRTVSELLRESFRALAYLVSEFRLPHCSQANSLRRYVHLDYGPFA